MNLPDGAMKLCRGPVKPAVTTSLSAFQKEALTEREKKMKTAKARKESVDTGGPPPEAFTACENMSEGDQCEFTRRG